MLDFPQDNVSHLPLLLLLSLDPTEEALLQVHFIGISAAPFPFM